MKKYVISMLIREMQIEMIKCMIKRSNPSVGEDVILCWCENHFGKQIGIFQVKLDIYKTLWLSKRKENICLQKYLYRNSHSSFICSGPS